MSDGFAGIPVAALDFYEDLEDDNSRTFWLANKHRYEEFVLAPLTLLAAELAADYGPAKIFRPYRDVRFAKDKTPFKTGQGVWFEQSHRYLEVNAAGLRIAGGNYHFSPDQLVRYRRALAAELPADTLAAALASCERAGLSRGGDMLKRLPRGVEAGAPHEELHKHKSIAVSVHLASPAWLAERRAKTEIIRRWRAMDGFIAWLDAHVGPAEENARRH